MFNIKKIYVMYKAHFSKHKTQLKRKPIEEGESIEQMIRRLTANHEPIPENVPALYTDRNDGVIPDTDIRHDRWDTAYEASNKFAASDLAKSADSCEVAEVNNDKNDEK